MTSHPQSPSIGSASTPSALGQLQAQESPRSEATTLVLDHGHVWLEQFVGGDLSVVNSARVSYAQHHHQMEEGDSALINFLLKHKHGTPFEHNLFTFNVKLPLFIAREWIRHRIGSFNEVSMRYTVVEPEFYLPSPENVRTRVGKAGAYTYETAPENVADLYRQGLAEIQQAAHTEYVASIGDGVAPELARLCLPVSVYTQWYWTVNARALMNFLALRNAPTAQWEIQQYAKAVEDIFADVMYHTHTAFEANGRVAP